MMWTIKRHCSLGCAVKSVCCSVAAGGVDGSLQVLLTTAASAYVVIETRTSLRLKLAKCLEWRLVRARDHDRRHSHQRARLAESNSCWGTARLQEQSFSALSSSLLSSMLYPCNYITELFRAVLSLHSKSKDKTKHIVVKGKSAFL